MSMRSVLLIVITTVIVGVVTIIKSKMNSITEICMSHIRKTDIAQRLWKSL